MFCWQRYVAAWQASTHPLNRCFSQCPSAIIRRDHLRVTTKKEEENRGAEEYRHFIARSCQRRKSRWGKSETFLNTYRAVVKDNNGDLAERCSRCGYGKQ